MAPLDFSRDKLAMWKLNGGGRNVEETKVTSALPATAVQRQREGDWFDQPNNQIYFDFITYMFDFYYCNNWKKTSPQCSLDNLNKELPDTDTHPPPYLVHFAF